MRPSDYELCSASGGLATPGQIRGLHRQLVWMALVERSAPRITDTTGAALCLAGAAIILYGRGGPPRRQPVGGEDRRPVPLHGPDRASRALVDARPQQGTSAPQRIIFRPSFDAAIDGVAPVFGDSPESRPRGMRPAHRPRRIDGSDPSRRRARRRPRQRAHLHECGFRESDRSDQAGPPK